MNNDDLIEIKNAINNFNNYHKITLPLCAAENIVSPFVRLPLDGNYQERYIMGGTNNYDIYDNFIGSQHLLPFYSLIENRCKELFNANYADSKTLSGMNCVTTILMSLTKINDRILLLSEDSGGHPSVIEICKRLGLNYKYIPFDYHNYDIDYEQLNQLIYSFKPDYICIAPSDIIFPYSIENIELGDSILLYDASQILGFIAGNAAINPLNCSDNIVLFGGTHKTIPGPTHGIILTNNKTIYDKLDYSISPKYIRNTQMNQVISLLFALTEFKEYGAAYTQSIIRTANELANELEKQDLCIAKKESVFSKTHQIFIKCTETQMNTIYHNSILCNVTLNKKERRLFGGFGIRLGVQEITRYNWNYDALKKVSEIIHLLSQEPFQETKCNKLVNTLPKKSIKYTFSNEVISYIMNN